jgi:hypothetical protein
MGFILIGDERIDIRMLHNIITPAQLNSIGFILRRIETTNTDKLIDIKSGLTTFTCKSTRRALTMCSQPSLQPARGFLACRASLR